MITTDNDLVPLGTVLLWIWKACIALLVIGNLKSVPFVWHLRILKGFRQVLRSNRPKQSPKPSQLFQPMILGSHSPLMELDYNLHKSNSTYFSDIDIGRSHLCCTLFASGIDKVRHARIKGLESGGDGMIGLALGGVCCSFKREIPAYVKYETWTRILSWDEKWMYIVTHFVRKNRVTPGACTLYPEQRVRQSKRNAGIPQDAVMASAVSKCVWKKGNRTVRPEDMLALAGLLPPRPGQSVVEPLQTYPIENIPLFGRVENVADIPFKMVELVENVWHMIQARLFPRTFVKRPNLDMKEKVKTWTWEQMEEERLRGMEVAKSLAELSKVDEQFTGDGAALGWQSDTW